MSGFAVLAMTPTLAVIGVLQVIRRGIEYAITRPAREVIYTVMSREDRYKSKGFIDTFVYRLGDQVDLVFHVVHGNRCQRRADRGHRRGDCLVVYGSLARWSAEEAGDGAGRAGGAGLDQDPAAA